MSVSWDNSLPTPLADMKRMVLSLPSHAEWRHFQDRHPAPNQGHYGTSVAFGPVTVMDMARRQMGLTTAVPHGLKVGQDVIVNPEPVRKRPDPAKELRRLKAGRRK